MMYIAKEVINYPTIFALDKREDGIYLIAVNEDLTPRYDGNILKITLDGKLKLFEGINPELGLTLDENRSISIEARENDDE